ncbi:MAG: gamma-glutamyl-gamma-aminobutyrate hydrolase family protein [Rhodospirillales bacterium]
MALVVLPCCVGDIDGHQQQIVKHKYVRAVVDGAGCGAILAPSMSPRQDVGPLLDAVDGVMLTGSTSNVHPDNYQGVAPRDGVALDVIRDETSLALIREAVRRDIPLLAICRGIQELNVALGGSLHQHVQEVAGRIDHRAPDGEPFDIQYGPAHGVTLTDGGVLADLNDGETALEVNSIHQQAIDRLAEGLTVEAMAADGTVEAVRITASRTFQIGVQWHPEHRFGENPFSRHLFSAFGRAVRAHNARR